MEKHRGLAIEDLHLFCDLVAFLNEREGASLRDAARELRIQSDKISRRLDRMETILSNGLPKKIALVRRQERRGAAGITQEGREFYNSAVVVVNQVKGLEQTFRQSESRRMDFNVGVTNTLLCNFLSRVIAKFPKYRESNIRLRFVEGNWEDFVDRLKHGNLDMAFGPNLPEADRIHDVELDVVNPGIYMCAVAPVGHPFAKKIVEEKRDSVSLDELKEESLFVVQRELQPGLLKPMPLPNFEKGGGVVSHYSSALAMACAGSGVAIVPHWHSLDDLRRQGLIVYVPVKEMGQSKMALYWPRYRRSQFPKALEEIAEFVRQQLAIIGMVPLWSDDVLVNQKLPNNIVDRLSEFHYGYLVNCSGYGVGLPEWRRSVIEWKKTDRRKFHGRLIIEVTRDEYELQGSASRTLISFTGNNCKRPQESLVAGLSLISKNREALLGTWTGADDSKAPVSGPIIVAKKELQLEELKEVVRTSQLRVFLNAETAAK